MSTIKTTENSLGTKPIGTLLMSLAVPAIIANVVNALCLKAYTSAESYNVKLGRCSS